MMKIKAYIDYLFWKRTWFRGLFIILPSWMIIPILTGNFGEPDSNIRWLWIMIYVFTLVIAAIDNKNVDNPPFPWNRGCLYYKTQKQVEDFFNNLASFITADIVFFLEQFDDLRPKEKTRFIKYMIRKQSSRKQNKMR